MGSSEIYEVSDGGPLRQCDILSGIVQYNPLASKNREPVRFNQVTHPFAIVLSQDCDLDWDYRARCNESPQHKRIPNVLFCEAIEAEKLRGREDINSHIWRRITQNIDERYGFLEQVAAEHDACGEGIPELGIDFKRYFTLATPEIYSQVDHGVAKRRARLLSPYLEHLASRFMAFQARVALPRSHRQLPRAQ